MPRVGCQLCSQVDEVNTMDAPLIVGIVVLALLLFALIKVLPDLVRYMKIRSM
jgi:type II secretory pathway component PulF